MSNFLNNTIDLEKIYNEIRDINNLIAQIKTVLNDENSDSSGDNTPSLVTFYYTGGYADYNGDWDNVDLTLQAEEGMTWAEWCASEYNTSEGRLNIDSEGIVECTFNLPAGYTTYLSVYYGYSMDDENMVQGNDVIVAEYEYTSPPTSDAGTLG